MNVDLLVTPCEIDVVPLIIIKPFFWLYFELVCFHISAVGDHQY